MPISSRWILYAEKAFPIPPIVNLFKKVAIDQLLLGSLIALIAFHYNERKFLQKKKNFFIGNFLKF